MNTSEHWLNFQKRGSQDSFRELVKQYAGLVFSAAQRRLLNPALAEEVCQVVFSRFAGCGNRFSSDAEIAAWLHRTTVHVAIDLVRSEVRRKNREQIASSMHTASDQNAEWQEIAPVLDEALNGLADDDRKALLLRFFDGRTMRELGGLLGITEDAAKMRVSRALERLRSQLVKCGVTASLVGLAGLMTSNCAASIPASVLSNLLARPVPAPIAPSSAINASKILFASLSVVVVLLLGLAKMQSGSGKADSQKEDTLDGQAVRARRPVREAVNEAPAAPKASTEQRTLRFAVIDAFSESPIPAAKVEAGKLSFLTDQAGECVVPVPEFGAGDFYFRLTVRKDGYVARYVSWSAYQRDTPTDIPERYTTRMEPATTIGGVVQNAEGGGIAGVRVIFNGPSPVGVADRDRTTVMGDFHIEITDEQGRWSCNHAPDPVTDLNFELRHPEYVDITYAVDGASGWPTGALKLPLDDLLTQRALFVMKHGAKLTGIVVDAAGNPVPGTRITVNRQWREPTATVTNAVGGRFLIPNLAGSNAMLTVQAAGFAPRTLEIDPTVTSELSITLLPGKTLRGRVVDAAGAPIANATVQLDRINFRPEVYKWSGNTDANGEFTWDSAPDDAHPYFISADGYHWKQVESWIADGQPKLVILEKFERPPPVFARGTVMDGVTGQPVPIFTLTINEVSKSGGTSPIRREFKNGEFALEVNRTSTKRFSLRVSADGYADWSSQQFPMPETDQHFSVQLKPTERVSNP